MCGAKRLRINGAVIAKAHATVKVGDVLTFPQARDIRIVRILALGTRRGPANEAQTLYETYRRRRSGPPSPRGYPGATENESPAPGARPKPTVAPSTD